MPSLHEHQVPKAQAYESWPQSHISEFRRTPKSRLKCTSIIFDPCFYLNWSSNVSILLQTEALMVLGMFMLVNFVMTGRLAFLLVGHHREGLFLGMLRLVVFIQLNHEWMWDLRHRLGSFGSLNMLYMWGHCIAHLLAHILYTYVFHDTMLIYSKYMFRCWLIMNMLWCNISFNRFNRIEIDGNVAPLPVVSWCLRTSDPLLTTEVYGAAWVGSTLMNLCSESSPEIPPSHVIVQ